MQLNQNIIVPTDQHHQNMKYPNVPGGNNMSLNGSNSGDDMDSLFGTACWTNTSNDFMDTNKLLMDEAVSNLGPDKLLLDATIQDDNDMNSKDAFSAMFSSHFDTSPNLTEMKPLPPFTNYTANLSINGIQGHHYHTISQRISQEHNNYNAFSTDQNIVSSSTCNITADSAGGEDFTNLQIYNTNMDDVVPLCGYDSCVNPDSVTSPLKYDDCTNATVADSATQLKNGLFDCYDTPDVHIARIMTNAAADSTVRNSVPNSVLSNTVVNSVATTCGNNIVTTISNNSLEDPGLSKDSWNQINDWDYFIADKDDDNITDCLLTTNNDYTKSQTMADYQTSTKSHQQQSQQSGSTLQSLLTHTSSMPLLQYRLENGPPMKQDPPSSSNYVSDHITTSSPPANVGSTTDSLLLSHVNGQYMSQYNLVHDDHRNQSPELLSGQNYPHTTTTSTPTPAKKSRSRAQKKQQHQHQQQQQPASSSTSSAYSDQSLRVMGKEKTLHRCSVCNRGFLNKSNIKVHLRTHTGEKPFRCDTCAKAFRQKAHLLKHQQIHKRINRD